MRSLCLAALALTLVACPDTKGRLDRFLEDSDPHRLTPAGIVCDGPVDASGEYFISAAVAVAPSKPILFRGDLVVDLTAMTVTLDMYALAVDSGDDPRAEVGDVISATGDLADDGTYRLDFGATFVPAAADPILPDTPVEADMAFVGCTRTAATTCGLIEGSVTAPTTLPLAGSTWGALALGADDDVLDAPILTTCAAVAETETP